MYYIFVAESLEEWGGTIQHLFDQKNTFHQPPSPQTTRIGVPLPPPLPEHSNRSPVKFPNLGGNRLILLAPK